MADRRLVMNDEEPFKLIPFCKEQYSIQLLKSPSTRGLHSFRCFRKWRKGVFDMKPILNFGVFQRVKEYETFNWSESGSTPLNGLRGRS